MSRWQRRVELPHDGFTRHLIMRELVSVEKRGDLSHGSGKYELDGRVALTIALDQSRHGRELIAQCWSSSPPEWQPARASDAWQRVNVYLPLDHGTRDMLHDLINELDAILGPDPVDVVPLELGLDA